MKATGRNNGVSEYCLDPQNQPLLDFLCVRPEASWKTLEELWGHILTSFHSARNHWYKCLKTPLPWTNMRFSRKYFDIPSGLLNLRLYTKYEIVLFFFLLMLNELCFWNIFFWNRVNSVPKSGTKLLRVVQIEKVRTLTKLSKLYAERWYARLTEKVLLCDEPHIFNTFLYFTQKVLTRNKLQ